VNLFKSYIIYGLVAFASASAYAKGYEVKSGTAEWQAVGSPGFLKINGKGGKVTGHAVEDSYGKVSGVFKVQLGEYTTGLETRDKHMKEKYLGTGEAVLSLAPVKATAAEFQFIGDLTIKGQTKPVTGTATLVGNKLTAKFKINVSDYPAIGNPEFAGVTMAKEVNVTVAADVQ
jgi:polyisoprenoid-binding protein YceI